MHVYDDLFLICKQIFDKEKHAKVEFDLLNFKSMAAWRGPFTVANLTIIRSELKIWWYSRIIDDIKENVNSIDIYYIVC